MPNSVSSDDRSPEPAPRQKAAEERLRRHSHGGRFFPYLAADALDPDEVWRFTNRPTTWAFAILRRDRALFFFALFLDLVFSLLSMLPAIVVGRFVDEVLKKHQFHHLVAYLSLIIAIPVFRAGLMYLFRHLFERISIEGMMNIRHALYHHLQTLDQSFYDATPTGTIMANMTGDLENIRHFFAFALFATIEQVFLFTIGIFYLFSVSLPLALATAAFVPIIFFLTRAFSRRIRPLWSQIRRQFETLNDVVQQNITGNRITRAFVRRDFEISRFEEENQAYRQANIDGAVIRSKFIPPLNALAGLMFVPIILLGGYLVMHQKITLGELIAFNGLLFVLQGPTQQIGYRIDEIQRFSTSANKIIDLLATRSRIRLPEEQAADQARAGMRTAALAEQLSDTQKKDERNQSSQVSKALNQYEESPASRRVVEESMGGLLRHDENESALEPKPLSKKAQAVSKKHVAHQQAYKRHGTDPHWLKQNDELEARQLEICEITGEIDFKHVYFRYKTQQATQAKGDSLSDINLHIPAGATVGIMGATGSGKSTLVSLIPRLYDADLGQVEIDGRNVRDYPLAALRRNIAVVTQDVFLFSDSVENNIAYGRPELPQAAIFEASQLAVADTFIQKLSEGYETIVGERGVGLSGGQRQRLSLARALAVQSKILILDDTTSAVDMETDRLIRQSLAERSQKTGCTTLIIASRISSVRHADCIYLMDAGRIVESGTHDELLQQNGLYRSIYDTQMGQVQSTLDDMKKAGS